MESKAGDKEGRRDGKQIIKNGMTSAVKKARIVAKMTKEIQVSHPSLVLTKRIVDFLKIQPWTKRPSTAVQIDPLMKMTGNAIPNVTLVSKLLAESSAGLCTSCPTKAYIKAPVTGGK